MHRNAKLATLFVIISACTSEPTSQSSQALSQSALAVLQDLQQHFVHRYEVPPSPEASLAGNDSMEQKTEAVFGQSEVEAAVQVGNTFTPSFKKTKSTTVALPLQANGPIELTSGGVTARVSIKGASTTAGQLAAGYIVYVGAAPSGHILLRATPDGVEDYITFNSVPATAAVDYSVSLVTGVAGLRLVADTVELLDAGGTPRLRMRTPYVVGSDGKAADAVVAVSGCNVDTNPASPWGRHVVTPGAATCTVHVSWNNGDVTYPAVLDPSWSSTGSMTQARADHTLTLLDDGHVLAAAGFKSGTLPGADLYDANTGTWAATGSPKKKRSEHVAVKLTNGKVLMAGGINGSTAQKVAELYNPATGTWTNTGSMATARRAFIGEFLPNGKVLVSGGYSPSVVASAELYDPTPATWGNTGSMATARAAHRSSVLVNNNVMVTGGIGTSAYQSGAEIYSQSAGTWSTGGTMTTARANHAQSSLGFDGRVIVGGGYTGTATTTSVDRWDPTTNTWSAGPALATSRMKMGAALAGGAQVLFAAGLSGTTTLSSSELLQNYPPTMEARPTLVTARSNFPLVRLADGRLLAAGGLQGSTYLTASEIYDPSDPGAAGNAAPEQSSPPRLSMEWDVEDPLGSYALGTGTLGATVKNNTDNARTAYVDVVAVGLDERQATRSAYFDVTVPAWGSVAVSVPMSVWPIRSVGTESEVHLKLREYVAGTGDTGFVDYTSERRYEVDISYTTLTLHGIQGKDLDRPQPAHTTTTEQWWANLDAAKGDLRTLIGMIWNGSAFVELAAFAPQSNGAKGEYSWRGRLAGDIQDYFNLFVVNYVPSGNVQTYTMCSRWRGKFLDASIGSQLTTADHPASYAWSAVRVWTGSSPWIAWVGQLEATGCTPPIQIEAGLWADIVDVSYVKNTATGTIARVEFGANTIANTLFGTTFTGVSWSLVVPSVGGTYSYVTNSEDFNTRAAAVVGRAMSMQDNGFAASTTFQVNSNTGCGCGQDTLYDQYCKPQEACGGGGTLGIGWVLLPSSSTTTCQACVNPPQPPITYVRGQKHNTQYKQVVSHELGHVVQGALSGTLRAGAPKYYVAKPSTQGGPPPYQCSCDFVQEGNQLHCLQSREEQRNAIVEGYGHFFAARVINDLTQAPCNFPYSKTVAVWEYNPNISGYAWDPKAPPYPVTCTGPAYNGVGWMVDQCKTNGQDFSITNRGTEWDWLTFLYDVSRPGGSGIPFADPSSSNAGLTRVWRNACGNGSWVNDCGTGMPGTATVWFGGYNGGQGLVGSVNQLTNINQLTFTQQNNFVNVLGPGRGVNH